MTNESCYVKWLCKRWNGIRLMTLDIEKYEHKNVVGARQGIGTPVFDGDFVSIWSEKIEG